MKTYNTVDDAIALLNKKGPRDWFNKINLDEFFIQHTDSCVLYFVFGGYIEGQKKLGIYNASSPYTQSSTRAFWCGDFNDEWKEKIKKLQQGIDYSDIDYQISVMQAFKEGKTIEITSCGRIWSEAKSPSWNWGEFKYRVKEVTYSVGDCFEIEGSTYILAAFDCKRVTLIDLNTGARWEDGVEVGSLRAVSEKEFSELSSNAPFTKI